MTTHSFSLACTHRWWPFGYAVLFVATGPLSPKSFSPLIHRICTELLPAEIFQGVPLEDLRGGPGFTWEQTARTDHKIHQQEELFTYSGKLPLSSPKTSTEARLSPEHFQEDQIVKVRVKTPFLGFRGTSHITHKTHIDLSDPLASEFPPEIALSSLGRLLTLKPLEVSLTVQFFSPAPVPLLGFAPVVRQSLCIEGTPEQYRIEISAEGLSRQEVKSLLKKSHYEKVVRLGREVLAIDLEREFQGRLILGT